MTKEKIKEAIGDVVLKYIKDEPVERLVEYREILDEFIAEKRVEVKMSEAKSPIMETKYNIHDKGSEDNEEKRYF